MPTGSTARANQRRETRQRSTDWTLMRRDFRWQAAAAAERLGRCRSVSLEAPPTLWRRWIATAKLNAMWKQMQGFRGRAPPLVGRGHDDQQAHRIDACGGVESISR